MRDYTKSAPTLTTFVGCTGCGVGIPASGARWPLALMAQKASLKRRNKNALQEVRFLLLGAQVMLAFQGRAGLLPGYTDLSPLTQTLCFWGLIPAELLLVVLLAPLPFHKIVEQGCNSERMHQFTTRMALAGLLLFGLALGVNLSIASDRIFGTGVAVGVGVAVSLLSFGAWFGLEAIARARKEARRGKDVGSNPKNEDEMPELSDRIDQTLSEGSMVVPGNTALLGFGFITMLLESFGKLPKDVQYVQFAGITMITLSTILLMTPAAYHRLVDRGEDTEDFYKLSSRLLTIALIPFALGINANLYLVAYQVTESYPVALTSALVMLTVFYGVWFGYTFYRRKERERQNADCPPAKEDDKE